MPAHPFTPPMNFDTAVVYLAQQVNMHALKSAEEVSRVAAAMGAEVENIPTILPLAKTPAMVSEAGYQSPLRMAMFRLPDGHTIAVWGNYSALKRGVTRAMLVGE